MSVTERRRPTRPRWVLERRWSGTMRPLPWQWVPIDGSPIRALADVRPDRPPLDFTARIRRLCEDITRRCPELSHIDPSAVLFSFTRARNRSVYGLQARVTPLRFRNGEPTRRYRGTIYQVQRYYVGGREMLYLVTFCLPRFLDQTFAEKLVTVFHELYHISPNFNGDLRRHAGRYEVHSHSKREYDARMADLVKRYLADHPEPGLFNFLRYRTAQLLRAYSGIIGITVPRPKMIPVERW